MSETKPPKVPAKYLRHPIPDGFEVFQWPECKALIKRLGIDMEAPTTAVTIRIGCDEVVKVTHEFNGLDLNKPEDGK